MLKATDGGLDLAVAKALADAGISPKDVGAIVAHGTAVPAEDRCEVQAWHKAMGDAAGKVPAAAITGAIGSLFAGAGGVELAVAAMAVHTGTIPPTVNFHTPGGNGRLNLAATPRLESNHLRYVVSGAFGIGGQSAACVLKRCES